MSDNGLCERVPSFGAKNSVGLEKQLRRPHIHTHARTRKAVFDILAFRFLFLVLVCVCVCVYCATHYIAASKKQVFSSVFLCVRRGCTAYVHTHSQRLAPKPCKLSRCGFFRLADNTFALFADFFAIDKSRALRNNSAFAARKPEGPLFD